MELSESSFKTPENLSFISFEGIDGCGKTTQIRLLESWLKRNGFNVLCLREPGGTTFGEKLREAILESTTKLTTVSEAYLFASSRAQLLYEKILPFINQSKKNICILDRYIHSSIAYQGHARALGIETILDIHRLSPLNIMPNLTFYLNISSSTSIVRQKSRNNEKDYFEKEKTSFFDMIIRGYNLSKEKLPGEFITLNGERNEQEIHSEIIDNLLDKF